MADDEKTEPLTEAVPDIPDCELRPVAEADERFGLVPTDATCERCGEVRAGVFWWDNGAGNSWLVLKCDRCGGRLDSFPTNRVGSVVHVAPWDHTRDDDGNRRQTRPAGSFTSTRIRQECPDCHERNHPKGCRGPDFWGAGGAPNPKAYGRCDECKREDQPLLHCGARPPFPLK